MGLAYRCNTRMLRLGYLVPEFPSQTHIFFWREAQALRELGVELQFLSTRRPVSGCPHEFGPAAAAATHYVFPPRAGPALQTLARSPHRTATALGYLAALGESSPLERARRLGLLGCAADLAELAQRERLQHLHVHSCAEAAHLAALTSRLSGLPYSLTLHGDLPVYGRDHASKMSGARFVAVVTRALQKQVTSTIGLPVSRVPVIRMGVDVGVFAPEPGGRPAGTSFHFVSVARLAESKGHRFALAALRVLLERGLDARYTLAGDGPDRAKIEAEVVRLELSRHVHLAGSLGEAAVLDLLRSADALMLPSVGLGEAAPVAVMEAMAVGLPVVCSVIGGVPELVDSGVEGYLVPQGDANAIADALDRLARDPTARARMGAAARERAIAEFGARACAARLLQAIGAG